MADRLRLRAAVPLPIRSDDNLTSSPTHYRSHTQIRPSLGSEQQSKRDRKLAAWYLVGLAASLVLVGALLYLHSRATAAALVKATDTSDALSSSIAAARRNHATPTEKDEVHRPLSKPYETPKEVVGGGDAKGANPGGARAMNADPAAGARVRRLGHRVLTIYAQSINNATTAAAAPPSQLKRFEYESLPNDCSQLVPMLPVDAGEFPTSDPYLPWIHDYFVSLDSKSVHFVAQNRRRCQTGTGMEATMRYWEPQVALMQPVPVLETTVMPNALKSDNPARLRRYSLTTPENATHPETRFACSFQDEQGNTSITFSTYPFNYEYISWRKRKPMFLRRGRDVENFEFSTLLFRCPIPERLQPLVMSQSEGHPVPRLWLDVVPIRAKVRSAEEGYLLTENHVGPAEFRALRRFDASTVYKSSTDAVPPVEESGRWSDLSLCPPKSLSTRSQSAEIPRDSGSTPSTKQKEHHFVLCTWTSASYKRRGDAFSVGDAAHRLSEWIAFHRLVGVDHIYLYDNTPPSRSNSYRDGGGAASYETPIGQVVRRYEGFVTHIPWPYQVCSNNRATHKNPGERSSQYAAEASCRERFGPTTEWMSFLDTDEYLIPLLNGATNWTDLLRTKEQQGYQVLKLRSARGKPRLDLMEPVVNESVQAALCRSSSADAEGRSSLPEDPCVVPRQNETFLKVYNCNYIRPPIPDRFARAMKQIYRPAFVHAHFVHYATVTSPIARYYKDWLPGPANYTRKVRKDASEFWKDVFLDDLTEGILIHTKSVLPHETMTRTTACQLGSKQVCSVGFICPATTQFVDADHQKNVFRDASGGYCNCWIQEHVDQVLIPLLERSLREGSSS